MCSVLSVVIPVDYPRKMPIPLLDLKPQYAKIRGEARSHDSAFNRAITHAYRDAFNKAKEKVTDHKGRKARMEFRARQDYFPFRLSAGSPVVKHAVAAAKEAGFTPQLRISNGGLDANWLVRHGVPRWAAVLVVIVGGAGIVAGFLAAAIPPMASEATALAHQVPHYLHDLQDRNSQLGKFNVKYHVQDRLTKLLTSGSGSLVGGVIGAGALVIGTVSEILAIAVLSIYFLAGLPQIKLFTYRLIPHSRRPRAILIGDEIFAKVGGYMLGSFITAVIAGLGTYLWLLAWGVPYPLLLGTFVAFLDLIPVIGSTVGGIVVSLVALTVSLPVALGTLGFYVFYRLAEDYLIVPRIQRRTLEQPALVSLVAVLIGGVLLGIVGVLVAIPVAAAVRLLLKEVAFPRLDKS